MTVTEIPAIIDVDAHVVEPADVWSSRLPGRYRQAGPHVVYLPSGHPRLDGGTYIEEPGTEGPDVAWWFYEDRKYSIKRLIAAAGYPADEITMQGVTYAQMRPGCWKPADRIADNELNGVQAQMCLELYKLGVTVNAVGPGGMTRITATMGGGRQAFEPDSLAPGEYHPMDPAGSSPLVAWLASDESQHITGQVIRAIHDKIYLMGGWTEDAMISAGGQRWDATTLGNRIATDIFRTRARGLS